MEDRKKFLAKLDSEIKKGLAAEQLEGNPSWHLISNYLSDRITHGVNTLLSDKDLTNRDIARIRGETNAYKKIQEFIAISKARGEAAKKKKEELDIE